MHLQGNHGAVRFVPSGDFQVKHVMIIRISARDMTSVSATLKAEKGSSDQFTPFEIPFRTQIPRGCGAWVVQVDLVQGLEDAKVAVLPLCVTLPIVHPVVPEAFNPNRRALRIMSFGFSVGDFVAAANLAYKLVLALSESSGSSMEYQQLIQDLSCVHRTFLQVEQMKDANQLNQSTINALIYQVNSTKIPIQAFLEKTEKYRKALGGGGGGVSGGGPGSAMKDSWRKVGWSLHKKEEVKALRDLLQLRLLSMNMLLSTACYIVVNPPKPFTFGPTTYALEEERSVPEPDWNSDLVVFEHIGLKSGGDIHDPGFSPQGDGSQMYFRVGQVFMLLWDAPESDLDLDVDTDSTLVGRREWTAMISNRWSSPFVGPTTVRRFLVVREGMRSSFCLPISTLRLEGCSSQPDQENYGIIFTGSHAPAPLPRETGMTKPPIRVNATHPSAVLAPQSRLDYRRLCEVEHNVRCQSVGLVDIDSMTDLLNHLKPCRIDPKADTSASTRAEDDGLDIGIE